MAGATVAVDDDACIALTTAVSAAFFGVVIGGTVAVATAESPRCFLPRLFPDTPVVAAAWVGFAEGSTLDDATGGTRVAVAAVAVVTGGTSGWRGLIGDPV